MLCNMRAGCSIVYPVGSGGTPSKIILISVLSPGNEENSMLSMTTARADDENSKASNANEIRNTVSTFKLLQFIVFTI